jgi:cellulose biosynthesis protein BcsQ/class 3 adenylate cyclase
MSSIVTFYSYKGGVGRTMALANVGVLLSKWGKRVLMVDWDLEAPGLEYFFFTGSELRDVRHRPSVVDMLLEFDGANRASTWESLLVEVKPTGAAALWMITAGARKANYFRSVRDLDVKSFYEQRGGGYFIESLRSHWKANYDFILIDSRTGITDIGGICTIQLPDILALVFTATEQSLMGAVSVTRKAAEERQKLPVDRALVPVVPLPSKFDTQTERDVSQRWLDRFVKETAQFYRPWLPKEISHREFLEVTKIPYSSFFSFGEGLPVLEQGTTDPTGLGFAYETIAAIIGNELQNADLVLLNRDELIRSVRSSAVLPRTSLRETSNNVVLLLDCVTASLLRTAVAQAPETAAADEQVIQQYESVVAGRAKREGADLIMSDGDRALFAFGEADQAIRCAINIQEELSIARPIASRLGVLRPRAAVHERGMANNISLPIDTTFEEVARTLTVAKDGQIIISAPTRLLLSERVKNVRFLPKKEQLEITRKGNVEFERLFELVSFVTVHLTDSERDALFQQDPKTKSLGGFQAFLVNLQKKVQEDSNRIVLTVHDRERIARYASDYRGGGWQARLLKIFGRTLGRGLGRNPPR